MELFYLVLPAIFAGLMIVFVHSILGVEVLKRGIVFMDIAIAQLAGFGFVFSKIYLEEASVLWHQLIALLFAFSGAILFRVFEKMNTKNLEALIGTAFVFTAALSLLLLADNPHAGEEIQNLLSGQILFVTWGDVLTHAPVYMIVFILWFTRQESHSGILFYMLFALAITSSVQLVGVYVVFVSLILPALVVGDIHKNKYRYAWLYGSVSLCLGVLVSIVYDMPSGPVIVTSYVLTAILWRLFNKFIK